MERNVGFVFDIDGVLYRGEKDPVPGAKEALQSLYTPDGVVRVPHLFISNGAGTEDDKAALLREMFDIPVSPLQFVLPLSLIREIVPKYEGKRVIVVASTEKVAARLAESLGLHDFITVQQYSYNHPHLFPSKHRHRLKDGVPPEHVDCVIVAQQPSDWWEGLQILIDILRSNGTPGLENEDSSQPVALYFGNPDYDYGDTHSLPRITCGAFRQCLEFTFHKSTGRTLQREAFGKPHFSVYRFAERKFERLWGFTPEKIYAIGDNPLSDIKGANEAGEHWSSVLVRTGCFKGGENDEQNPADMVCDTVGVAVHKILGGT
eukprot:comp22374_c0_seq1/m.33355 comp22374_c0_seq1/g.33355  ORF comp22374_c0_seq1/g.33355 comp22374_c0_seq1/m.33355 type:complete len:319 (-) comp22374_c0_seq1:742-1698(-)